MFDQDQLGDKNKKNIDIEKTIHWKVDHDFVEWFQEDSKPQSTERRIATDITDLYDTLFRVWGICKVYILAFNGVTSC